MNRKITVIFLSTVLPTALLAGPNGLTPEILNRANSIKVDSAALEGAISGPQGMLQATASRETASLMNNTRAGLVADKFFGAENQMTNNLSGLNSSLSSRSTASETASFMSNTRTGLMADKFSGAESQMTNNSSGLNSSLSSGSNLLQQELEQMHNSQLPESLVQ